MKVNLRTKALRDVRKDKLIPGVMYGKSIESTSIEVEDKAFKEALAKYGRSLTFEVILEGKKHNVYVKNVVTDILRPNDIIHFELHRIAEDETVSTTIPVVIHGREALAAHRLYIQMGLTEINCEYLSGSGISSFEFDASEMGIDEAIHIKDVVVPKGVTIKEDLEQIVFIVKEAQEEPEEDEETEAVVDETDEDLEETEEE